MLAALMLSMMLLSSALLLHGMTMNQPPATQPSSVAEHGSGPQPTAGRSARPLSMETLIAVLLLLTIPGLLTCLPSPSNRD